MKMKMTKQDLLRLNDALLRISKLGTTKFKHVILKNINMIKQDVTILEDLKKEVENQLVSYNEDRNKLILEIGTVKNGDSVGINLENKEEVAKFNEGLKKLSETHKDAIELYDQKAKEFLELLNGELEEKFNFKQFTIDEIPQDGISFEILELLEKLELIKE